MTKLYVLRLIDDVNRYDNAIGYVIRAANEASARVLAEAQSNDADIDYPRAAGRWLDPKETTCEELLVDGPAGIILTDYHHG